MYIIDIISIITTIIVIVNIIIMLSLSDSKLCQFCNKQIAFTVSAIKYIFVQYN